MKKNVVLMLRLLLIALPLALVISFSIRNEDAFFSADDPKVANLKLPQGFKAERLYGPSDQGDGSWVSMTFDNKGRIIASDQYGYLYRLMVPAIGDTINKTTIEKLEVLKDPAFITDTTTGKVSEEQRKFLESMKETGYYTKVSRGFEETVGAIKEYFYS